MFYSFTNVCRFSDAKGFLNIFCVPLQCNLIVKYILKINGDWAFMTIIYGTMSASSNYYLFGLVEWIDGVPNQVLCRNENLYKALLTSNFKSIVELKQNFGENWQIHLHNSKWNGYTLATDEIMNVYGNNIENNIHTWQNNNVDFDFNQEYLRRKQLAKNNHNGIVYKHLLPKYEPLVEIDHCWWRWIVHFFIHVVKLIWCSKKWEKDVVIDCVQATDVNFLVIKTKYYVTVKNKTQDPRVSWDFKTPGDVCKQLIKGWINMLCKIAKISYYEENHSPPENNNFCTFSTTILIYIRISHLMHESFGLLLKYQFESGDNGIHPDVRKIKDNVKLATKLAYNYGIGLVCMLL